MSALSKISRSAMSKEMIRITSGQSRGHLYSASNMTRSSRHLPLLVEQYLFHACVEL
ncbi:hypothetical protein ACJIZ3_001415 [Penstemon smallii]|uniref:Uncharacterized protein n=1 Tax=Penstemon smallii TaxID=265156 RepID=A0ABD3U6N2_9LAMI